jgi:hypothetical protein
MADLNIAATNDTNNNNTAHTGLASETDVNGGSRNRSGRGSRNGSTSARSSSTRPSLSSLSRAHSPFVAPPPSIPPLAIAQQGHDLSASTLTPPK